MDAGDAFLTVMMSVGFIKGLRRFLEVEQHSPAWDKWLSQLRFPVVVVLGVYVVSGFEISQNWFWAVTLALGLNTIRLLWDYKPARTVLLAVVPVVVAYFTEDSIRALAPGFFKVNREFFSAAIGFSWVWLGTFLLIASRQKKSLLQQQLEREALEVKNQQIEAENSQLERQVALRTAELTRQKEELLQTVADLKATQEQLVQKEKMASLGELTAGIAHEIQNPLNFVNNFAEVSVELMDELGDQLQAGYSEDLQELMNDIRQNLEKINYHGHRADAIVKAMLQHSRSSSGDRQPTDINALCDEFLRLSYHGLRAKDSTFNATMLTDFDPNIGRLTVMAQDVGRVLLNLLNNAFYAVSEKKRQAAGATAPKVQFAMSQTDSGISPAPVSANYEPTVKVSTKKAGDSVVIRVYDNGCGIPQAVLDKIYQPFFTTKPTGEGTGLGLSLSYDIITKGHNGTLRVDTKEGEFTEFIIELPHC